MRFKSEGFPSDFLDFLPLKSLELLTKRDLRRTLSLFIGFELNVDSKLIELLEVWKFQREKYRKTPDELQILHVILQPSRQTFFFPSPKRLPLIIGKGIKKLA